MVNILDGKRASNQILRRLGNRSGQKKVTLALVQVGHRPDSDIYVRQKLKAAAIAKVAVRYIPVPLRVRQKKLLDLLTNLGHDRQVDGILLQLPLPSHLEADRMIAAILPSKDVDGFREESKTTSPLVSAILHLLRMSKKKPGKVVLLGANSIFRQRLATRLKQRRWIVSESQGQIIPATTKKADLVITFRGRGPRLQSKHLKHGAVVIDAGIRRYEDRVVGDADESIQHIVSAYSPVPGGVGPLTVAYALHNIVLLQKKRLRG